MARLYFSLLSLSLISGTLLAQEKGILVPDLGLFPVQVYSAEDFDAHFQVLDLTISDKNLIYTANNTHLLEFDGATWRNYGDEVDEIIRRVKAGPNDRVYWAGPTKRGYLEPGTDGGLVYHEIVILEVDTTRLSANPLEIKVLRDNVFFVTDRGIIQYHPESDQERFFALPSDSSLSFTFEDKFYVSFQDGHLLEWKNNDFVSTNRFQNVDFAPIRDVFEWKEQIIVVGEDRVARCEPFPSSECKTVVRPDEILSGLDPASRVILDALLTETGLLVLSTQGAGIILYDLTSGYHRILNHEHGLANTAPHAIITDQEEGLWVATTGNVYRFDLSGNLTYFPEDIYFNGFTSAQMGGAGPFQYVTTTGGVFGLDKRTGEWQNVYPETEWCRSFAPSALGLLTACGNKIVALNGFEAREVFSARVKMISLEASRLHANRFYAGSQNDLVVLEVNDAAQLEARYYDEAPFFSRGFYEQGSDTLWMGSLSNGIFRFIFEGDELNKIEHFGEEQGVTGQYPRPLEIDEQLKFVSTNGLFSIKNGLQHPVFAEDTTFTRSYNHSGQGAIWSAVLGQKEGYWLAGDARLSLAIKQASGAYRWEEYPLLRKMMAQYNLTYVDQESEGILWSAWVKKLARFRLDAQPLSSNYYTLLRSVVHGDSTLYKGLGPSPGSIDIPQKNNAIQITYAAPRYGYSEQLEYAIKLEGFDENWSSWTHQSSKEYTGLRQGSYRFLVKARDVYGIESRPAAMNLHILAPWYQSRLFLTSMLILSLISILVGARSYSLYRTRLLEEKNVQLENVILERTKEISNKNDELLESNRLLEVANTDLSVMNDQLKLTNEELQAKTLELRNALEANKDILGITAHDLKNPISGMLSMAELLLIELKEDEREALLSVHEFAPLFKQESHRMLTIIEELLNTYREEQLEKLNRKETSVHGLVSGVIKMNHSLAKEKDQTLQFLSHVNEEVALDRSKMERVLDNLISNAIKYSDYGGQIKVTTDKKEDMLRIAVTDSGPGLSEEDKKKVFGKLQRLSAKPTAGERSTGLGLYIVKQLVEYHGGEVGVDSELGHGATFWVQLSCPDKNPVEKA